MAKNGNTAEKKEFLGKVLSSSDIAVGDGFKIKLSIIENEKHQTFLDIRQFYMEQNGAWYPTRKGIWLKLNGGDFTAEDILQTGLELIIKFRGK